jgi:hypothetical protein
MAASMRGINGVVRSVSFLSGIGTGREQGLFLFAMQAKLIRKHGEGTPSHFLVADDKSRVVPYKPEPWVSTHTHTHTQHHKWVCLSREMEKQGWAGEMTTWISMAARV